MWPFTKRRRPEPALDWAPYAALAHPSISRTQHKAASERLAIPQEVRRVSYIENGAVFEFDFLLGTVDLRDLHHRDGYHIVFEGYDRFGWPLGHPDSPATPEPPQSATARGTA